MPLTCGPSIESWIQFFQCLVKTEIKILFIAILGKLNIITIKFTQKKKLFSNFFVLEVFKHFKMKYKVLKISSKKTEKN